MAFDVYVGGFARYFAREWENVAQKHARETGMQYHMIGPNGPPQAADWNEAADAVSHWRAAINQGLATSLRRPLEWDESRDAPYFTDRPGYDGYGALLVWAAHSELGTQPPDLYDGEWFGDAAYQECAQPKQGRKYRPITCGSLWLPGEFDFSFDFESLTGDKVHICSCAWLQHALEELNNNTFRMSAEELAAARQGEFDENPSLKDLAKFGLALFHRLAEEAVRHHLPIMLSN